MQSLYTAATGMKAATITIDVIAHNLANGSTTGYKRERAEFQDLIYLTHRRVGTQTADDGTLRPVGSQIGLGATLVAVYDNFAQGPSEITNNSLDLSINGKGFFRVTLPDGSEAYTRAGTFQLNAQGTIVTADGYQVSPGITIPPNAISVTVNNSGEVLVTLPNQTAPSNVGQFDVVRFQNEAGLEHKGQNLYSETEASGAPIDGVANQEGFGFIMQGSLEGSNVDTVLELTDMIKAQRLFELNVKVLSASDESMKTLNQSA
ncbi:MAG: flagellar basal-body rod protein FlgG [Rickettsiales bacterium]